jgi:hypothetical protein
MATQPQRYGMTLPDGKSVHLGGPWPFAAGSYSNTSFLGRTDQVRRQALQVAKRLHDQTVEIATAKAARRDPKIPDAPARQMLAKKDRETLLTLRKAFDDVERDVFNMEVSLRPFDEDTSLSGAIVRAQLRDRLFQANDQTKTELLKVAEYRRAAYEAPPQTSGVSPLTYARLKQEDIARRHPEEVQTIKQFREAEQILDGVFNATVTALGQELQASGVIAAETEQRQEPAPQAEQAWA